MNVLSVFDGISAGQVALKRAKIKINKYFASEIDQYTIQVTQNNYPNTIQLGDITQIKGKNLPKIDILIGGSPCQGFSLAGKQLNFNDPRSKLFFEFVRLLKECKPKYFLLENVKMKQEYQDIISKKLNVKPVEINSALVSAQNRKRLYWTNIPILKQPKDKDILLKDILEKTVHEKYYVKKNWIKWWTKNKSFQIKKKYSAVNPRKALCMMARQYASWNGTFVNTLYQLPHGVNKGGIKAINGKTPTLTSSQWQYNNILINKKNLRKLTPIECERLQTLPDNYTEGISDAQRYKMLGNGWTVDIITHILKGIKNDPSV